MNPDVFVGLNEHVFSTIPSVGYICGKKLDASNAVYGTLVITSRHLLLVLKSSAIRFLPSFIDRVLNMGLKKVRGLDLRPNVIGLFTSKVEKIEGGSFAVTTKDFPAETKKPEHFLFSASFSDHRIFSEIEQSIEIGRDPRKLEKAIADKSKLFVEEAIQLTSDSEVVLLDQACFRLEIERTSHMEFVLTSDRILMRHICWHDPSSWKMFRWNDIESIQPIPVFYADVAFEMGLFSGASYMLVFGSKTTRDDAVQIMKSKASNMCKESVDELQRAWRHDKITTRDYLIAINRMGGRSMNNIMRYPIFPWILSMDPDVESMDFENDSMFRDLKKPMIFQNVDMIQYTKTLDFIPCPTHVERIASMLCCARPELRFRYETMDGAKFHNLSKLWHRSAKEGRGNMEAIPEFYKGDGQMFLDVEDPSHIIIPKWASDPEEFVRLNEMALEDERVSMGLPTWLDVTFGTSQVHASYKGWKSGCAYDPSILAKRADTLLFSSIYETSLWKRPTMPLQIFDRPHVSKKVKLVEVSSLPSIRIRFSDRCIIDLSCAYSFIHIHILLMARRRIKVSC
eukprot:TRINITY_DN789_c0_g1_i2.p1 TRINITY_DN789_c0_g1~~TRINITY_DN789_c0_g1_i2.p1  ORF type:complete len:568 (-),score=128.68 TRINITY_DN789_c0_g1_i2:651-2354(-)